MDLEKIGYFEYDYEEYYDLDYVNHRGPGFYQDLYPFTKSEKMDLVALFYAITMIPFVDDYILGKLYFDLMLKEDKAFMDAVVLNSTLPGSELLIGNEKFRVLHNSAALTYRFRTAFNISHANSAFNLTNYLFSIAKQYNDSEPIIQAGVVCHKLVNISKHKSMFANAESSTKEFGATFTVNFTSDSYDPIFHPWGIPPFKSDPFLLNHVPTTGRCKCGYGGEIRIPGMTAAGSAMPSYFPHWLIGTYDKMELLKDKVSTQEHSGYLDSRSKHWHPQTCPPKNV